MNQLKALQSVLTSLDSYVESLQKRIDLTRSYIEEQKTALEFVNQFPEDQPEDAYSSSRTRASISFDSGCVQGFMLNYNALTLDELVGPLKWLSQRLGSYTISEYPEIHRRSYIFSKGRFHFQVFFDSSDVKNVCKYVQVGVKEQPVYELRCE